MKYIPTIGLEIHAELKTASKMFCSCKNDPDEEKPNANICPICLGHPGTLPVLNMEAIRQVLRVGVALNIARSPSSSLGGAGGRSNLANSIADFTEWDRKNYFYPDIPKGYQISQYKYPLISDGELAGVALERIHLEEDTAKSMHDTDLTPALSSDEERGHASSVTNKDVSGRVLPPLIEGRVGVRSTKSNFSLINFNRSGVPLMELVTKPVIHDAATAVRFAKELQLLLRYLGAGDANMEKGEMRVEANISIALMPPLLSEEGAGGGDCKSSSHRTPPRLADSAPLLKEEGKMQQSLGTKTEVKNLNSFRAVEDAINYEVARQTALLEKGESVIQETRGWDESAHETFSQRSKESSHDYRYFPEPDIPKMKLSEIPEFSVEALKKDLPELPWAKRDRFKKDFGMTDKEVAVFIESPEIAEYYEEVIASFKSDPKKTKLATNYILSDYLGALRSKDIKTAHKGISKLTNPLVEAIDLPIISHWSVDTIPANSFSEIISMVASSEISSRGAKDLIALLISESGRGPTSVKELAEKHGLIQKSNASDIEPAILAVIEENASVVEEYKKGKTASLQFLIGQAMKATKGAANPSVVKELLVKKLG